MSHPDAQRVLYGMVKAKDVIWNNAMGRAGLYRLSPQASASALPPLGGRARAGGGTAGGGVEEQVYWGVHDARLAKTYEVLSDQELRWLADHGFLGLNRKGQEWYQGIDVSSRTED
jgi:hypothetical protein